MCADDVRRQHERAGRQHGTDPAAPDLMRIEPFLPPPKPGGQSRTTSLREVSNTILSEQRTGCPSWAAGPASFRDRTEGLLAIRLQGLPALSLPGIGSMASWPSMGFHEEHQPEGRRRRRARRRPRRRAGCPQARSAPTRRMRRPPIPTRAPLEAARRPAPRPPGNGASMSPPSWPGSATGGSPRMSPSALAVTGRSPPAIDGGRPWHVGASRGFAAWTGRRTAATWRSPPRASPECPGASSPRGG
jgi:hypothetical protein